MIGKKSIDKKSVFIAGFLIVSAVGVSGSGLDYFVTFNDQLTVSQPGIEMGFGSGGLLMWQSAGETVNLNETKSFNHSFSGEKTWYDLNVTANIRLENNKVENLSGFEFGAYNTETGDYYSCSSSVDSQGPVYCDNALSIAGKITGFNITFSKDNLSDPKLSSNSKISLEAAN